MACPIIYTIPSAVIQKAPKSTGNWFSCISKNNKPTKPPRRVAFFDLKRANGPKATPFYIPLLYNLFCIWVSQYAGGLVTGESSCGSIRRS